MSARPSIPFLLDLLRLAMRKQAAAVYVVPWMPPTLRIDDRSVPLSSASFTPAQAMMLVLDVLDEQQRAALDRSREIQFSFELADLGRFRVHAFRRHGQPAMAIRPYAVQPPTPRTLALPAQACAAVMAERGLLLLLGRSSTLRRDATAALLEHRNRHGSGEIAVLDEASRFWHPTVQCRVRQGLNLPALDEVLQRHRHVPAAPLAIAWGELRDGMQLARAVRAAERALVVATLPADQLLAALKRLIALADEAPVGGTRRRTALALQGLLLLRPVPAADGTGELAATTLLLNSPQLAADLGEADLPGLRALVQQAADPDDHLWQLLQQGLVTADDALQQAEDRGAFARRGNRSTLPIADRDGAEPDPAFDTAPATAHRRHDPADTPVPPGSRTPVPATTATAAAAGTARVDSGFAGVFDPDAPATDPFAFAEASPAPRQLDTHFDTVDWQEAALATLTAPLVAPGPTSGPTSSPTSGPPSDPTPGALPGGAVADPLPTSAQFHAWGPAALAPGQRGAVDLWAALPAQATELEARARQALDLAATPPLPGDGDPVVALQLRIDGVLPPASPQRLAWHGRPVRVRVPVPVPAEARPGSHAARVRLAVQGVPIGELSFVLQVQAGARAEAPPEDLHAVRRMLRSAYAAYAQDDRAAVRARVQAARVVAPGLDVFLDTPSLHSSEGWREQIEQECSRRERLFLFWSEAAAESPWVDYEWRLMLRRGGLGLIDLVLLDPPRVAPLPPELSDLPVLEPPRRTADLPPMP